MTNPIFGRNERISKNLAIVMILSALAAASGCGGQSRPDASGESSEGGAASTSATGTAKKAGDQLTVAVLRLDSPDHGKEPGLQSIEDGIKQAKRPNLNHSVVEYSAEGDVEALAGLVDKALSEGADVIVTFLDVSTEAALAKNPPKPIVFAMANDPFGLGLGKSPTDHAPNVTGAYLPHRLTLTVEIARGSMPKAKKMGILFDPDNKLSSLHKENLLKCEWADVQALPIPYGKDADWAKLMDKAKADGVEALMLTNGLGKSSPQVIAEAKRVGLSVWGTLEKQAEEGAVFTREPDMRWTGFEVGRRVGRIVNGEDPAKIPFAEGDHYVTVVNTQAARDVGVTILPAIMRDIKDVSKPGETSAGGMKR